MLIPEVSEGLERLGVRKSDTLLVHSSFKSLGRIPYSAIAFLSAFIDYLSEGTLLLPALSYENVSDRNPCFDLRKTKSCIGYLPEVFRKNFDVIRSIHPTHSVCAIGREARSITHRHREDSTPCGPNSPFSLLPEYSGKILMLGCGLHPNTSMHAIEELFEPEYLFNGQLNYTIIEQEGICYDRAYTIHNFRGWIQRYDRIMNTNADNWVQRGHIFQAECHLLNARTLWEKAKTRLAKEPLYFVEKER